MDQPGEKPTACYDVYAVRHRNSGRTYYVRGPELRTAVDNGTDNGGGENRSVPASSDLRVAVTGQARTRFGIEFLDFSQSVPVERESIDHVLRPLTAAPSWLVGRFRRSTRT